MHLFSLSISCHSHPGVCVRSLLQYLLYSLYELDAEDYGDIFLDIAEAFMDSGQ